MVAIVIYNNSLIFEIVNSKLLSLQTHGLVFDQIANCLCHEMDGALGDQKPDGKQDSAQNEICGTYFIIVDEYSTLLEEYERHDTDSSRTYKVTVKERKV